MLLSPQSLDLMQKLLVLAFLAGDVCHQDLSLDLVGLETCLLEWSGLLG